MTPDELTSRLYTKKREYVLKDACEIATCARLHQKNAVRLRTFSSLLEASGSTYPWNIRQPPFFSLKGDLALSFFQRKVQGRIFHSSIVHRCIR